MFLSQFCFRQLELKPLNGDTLPGVLADLFNNEFLKNIFLCTGIDPIMMPLIVADTLGLFLTINYLYFTLNGLFLDYLVVSCNFI